MNRKELSFWFCDSGVVLCWINVLILPILIPAIFQFSEFVLVIALVIVLEVIGMRLRYWKGKNGIN
jgi:hypothetical protein